MGEKSHLQIVHTSKIICALGNIHLKVLNIVKFKTRQIGTLKVCGTFALTKI